VGATWKEKKAVNKFHDNETRLLDQGEFAVAVLDHAYSTGFVTCNTSATVQYIYQLYLLDPTE
jgi:hypothetical protein